MAAVMKRLALPLVAAVSFLLSFGAVAGLIAARDKVARSDSFWSVGAVRGMSAEHYESLADLAKSADLVVVGRVEDVSPGREWVAVPELIDDPVFGDDAWARFATVRISTERIIGQVRAPLRDRSYVDMEIFLPHRESMAELEKGIPEERAIYFLRNKGPTDSVEFYRFTNDEQGLLREVDGRVRIAPHGETHFLTELDGEPFEDVLSRVVAARGSS